MPRIAVSSSQLICVKSFLKILDLPVPPREEYLRDVSKTDGDDM